MYNVHFVYFSSFQSMGNEGENMHKLTEVSELCKSFHCHGQAPALLPLRLIYWVVEWVFALSVTLHYVQGDSSNKIMAFSQISGTFSHASLHI